jgi:hypothetical protein
MKEPYSEGFANHTGPESCAGTRESAGEALTGVHTGRVLSCEINPFGTPTLFTCAEGETRYGANRESCEGPAQSETLCMCGNSKPSKLAMICFDCEDVESLNRVTEKNGGTAPLTRLQAQQ